MSLIVAWGSKVISATKIDRVFSKTLFTELGFIEKGWLFPKKMMFGGQNLPYLEVRRIYLCVMVIRPKAAATISLM